ncbi:NaeI family type II restriction endonuclease [Actinoplanes sp. NPDC023714]|uniref:NaeI family type II restriction endonuclease n=1 Tax=Actinoplanes sp. NPDC023714 TaxID=3154322 RepID=UPI0034030DA7
MIGSLVRDVDLQRVHAWLASREDLAQTIGDALEDTIYYVLDCARTGRYDLSDPRVDSDEKRVIGTKLQYHVLQYLKLEKKPHPDTEIDGVGVELKGTIGKNWTIPREGQCGITLAIRLDVRRNEHESWLIRTHRAWLNDGVNNDGKRGISKAARSAYGVRLYPTAAMRNNPLKDLTPEQSAKVFDGRGQQPRLIDLFCALPKTVIPRPAILTVCAGRDDPMKRVRDIRPEMLNKGYKLLCGKWPSHRSAAARFGLDLSAAAWAAIPAGELAGVDA